MKGQWVIGSCAFAKYRHKGGVDKNPSFGIKVEDTLLSRYHCFSCGSSGDLMDLAMDIMDLESVAKQKTLDTKAILSLCADAADEGIRTGATIPPYSPTVVTPVVDYDFPDWWLNKYPKVMTSKTARAYLSTREITVEVAEYLDLRWDEDKGRVGFPFRNEEELLCGMNGRAVYTTGLRYYQYQYENHTNLHLWYGESWMDLDKTLVVTESVFDLASILRVYPNVVAGFSCSFSNTKALRLGGAVSIITLFDAGEGGDRARKVIKECLGDIVAMQIVPPEDAGAVTEEWLYEKVIPYLPKS